MTTTYTLDLLLKLSLELENLAYDFYGELEARFTHKPELAKTLAAIKADEKMHIRVVEEIRKSLTPVRLKMMVPAEPIQQLETALEFIRSTNVNDLKSSDDICDAIERLEAVEFDVALAFVDISEINYDFTKQYLKNQTVEHTNKIYHAQQCFE